MKNKEQLYKYNNVEEKLYWFIYMLLRDSFDFLKDIYPNAKMHSIWTQKIDRLFVDFFYWLTYEEVNNLKLSIKELVIKIWELIKLWCERMGDSSNDRKIHDSKALLMEIFISRSYDWRGERLPLKDYFIKALTRFLNEFEDEDSFNRWKQWVRARNNDIEQRVKKVSDIISNNL